MSGLLEKFVYADKELTLKEQARLVDLYLDMVAGMLWDTFPDLKISRSGSVLYNDFSMSVGEDVKVEVLSKKELNELIDHCSSCGTKNSIQIKKWKLERMINESKERVQTLKTKEKEGLPK